MMTNPQAALIAAALWVEDGGTAHVTAVADQFLAFLDGATVHAPTEVTR